jgi:hypothetical protein
VPRDDGQAAQARHAGGPARTRARRRPAASRDDPDGTVWEALCEWSWGGFIDWAWRSAEVRRDFTAATGVVLDRRTPIEAMVDRATGYDVTAVARFVEWVTVELWGIEGAPRAAREAIAAGTFVSDAEERARADRAKGGRGGRR